MNRKERRSQKNQQPDQELFKAVQHCVQLQQSGKPEQAAMLFTKLVAAYPKQPDVLHLFGVNCYLLGDFDTAIEHIRRAININPNVPEYYSNLANALDEAGRTQEAIPLYEKRISFNPFDAVPHYNLGIAYDNMGEKEKAMECFDKAINLDPKHLDSRYIGGNTLQSLGRYEEAIKYHNMALELDPNDIRARYNRALLLLLTGDLTEGSKEYECRWQKPDFPKRPFNQPWWQGEKIESTLLVWGEQGIGDEIMFSSLLPEAKEKCNQLLVEIMPRLVPILERSFPDINFVEKSALPADEIKEESVTHQCPMGSLMCWLRLDLESFPNTQGYLKADEEQTNELHKRYNQALGEGLKIGISWHTTNKKTGEDRSITLDQWQNIFDTPDTHFVSLQYGNHAEEINKAGVFKDEDIDPMKDMDAFAAQVATMDLIISIDNSTVHLAGALGKPVWTLLPFDPDWRWLLNREDSPWYPSMRLFRQEKTDEWTNVLNQVAEALANFKK